MKKFVSCALVAIFFCLIFVGCNKKTQAIDCYDIKVNYYDNGLIAVDLTVTYHKKMGEDMAHFNLFPKGECALKLNKSTANFKLIKVMVNGADANYSYDTPYCLLVDAPNIDTFDVTLKYTILLGEGEGRLCKTKSGINMGNFLILACPVIDGKFIKYAPSNFGDPFVSQVANFNVSLIVPSTYVVSASANAKTCDIYGDKTLYSYTQNYIRDFCFSLSKNYNINYQKWGNKPVIYYFYNDTNSNLTSQLIMDALCFYQNIFNTYPYGALSICQTTFSHGGMEYPLMAFVADNLSREEFYFAIAHEIAHQWWYSLVGVNQVYDYYIDEGFAQYSAYLFFKNYPQYGVDTKNFVQENNLLVEGYKNNPFKRIAVTNFSSDEDYYINAYAYPFYLIYKKAQKAGESAVIRYMQSILNDYKNKFVPPSAFDFFID